MKKWKIRPRKTPFGIRWDVLHPWLTSGGRSPKWVVEGLVGDDNHKTRASAVKHALARYGKQRL